MNAAFELHKTSLGVLAGIDLVVEPGAALAVMGENGAGKSTLLGVLAGVLAAKGVRRRTPGVYLPESSPLDAVVPVRTWLKLARGLPGWDQKGEELVSTLGIGTLVPLSTPAGGLSQGQRLRVGLVLALGRAAPAYILDDPFLGLDAAARAVLLGAVAQRAAEATLILATQDVDAATRLCPELLLLRRGRVVVRTELDAWREHWRRVRLPAARRGELAGMPVRRLEERGAWVEVLLEDPDGKHSAALGDVERLDLPLPETFGLTPS